jgi:hypothetical protein
MDKKRWKIVSFSVLLVVIALALLFRNSGNNNLAAVESSQQPTACPADTYICPNNEKVSRVLPNCQFAACPTAVNPSPAAIFKD